MVKERRIDIPHGVVHRGVGGLEMIPQDASRIR